MTEIKVNPAEIEFFQQNGYIQYHDFLSQDQIASLRQALDRAVSTRRERIRGADKGGRLSEEYERVFNQMVNLWTDYPQTKEIAFDKRLGEYARQLSRCRHVRIYHDHAMIKPPGQVSKQTNWHQDAPYWPMDPVGALSAWIAVDDVTIENGCLHFVPGSHSHGPLDPISLESDDDSVVERLKDSRSLRARAGRNADARRRRDLPPRLHLPLRRPQPLRQAAARLCHHLHPRLYSLYRRQGRGRCCR